MKKPKILIKIMDEKDLFMKKFEEKLKNRLDKTTLKKLSNSQFDDIEDELTSKDYEQFRLETISKGVSIYEKICNFSEKILNLKSDEKTAKKIQKNLYISHLNCTPTGVTSTSILLPLLFLMLAMILLVTISSTIGMGIIFISLSLYFALESIPSLLARRTKAKANDEIIIGIFYIVAFMRFNSNFELAVSFAANYLSGPLSLDFKRILWQLDNSEFPNIKTAFDIYLEDWRDENLEFLEAIYLIESSLFESEEFRRITLLDKALDIILQGNYEKMLHFAQDLRGKVSTFNMIGIVLPILGLIILPLAASFGDPKSIWQIVFLLYNILFPAGVAYFGFIIIFDRPSSTNSIRAPKNIKNFDKLQKFALKISKNKTIYLQPKIPALTIFFLFLLIGLSPIIFHITGIDITLNNSLAAIFGNKSPFGTFQDFKLIDKTVSYNYGPYGIYPGLISLFIPLSFAFGIGYYLKYKYKNLIHLRDKTKKLEMQFTSATFQLGNRINEGISPELAFGIVAETMKGTEAGEFFSQIDSNIKFNGMSVETAIFDKDKGAIINYPSDLIRSSMKIFVHASEKGPEITAKTLVDLSKYLSEIHLSGERMNDLLAESLGSMKGQASFLAPIISGVVIAIVSLITMIMGVLSKATNQFANTDAASAGAGALMMLGNSIPTYLFQSVVGIYLVMLVVILVYMTTNLENGEDSVNTKYQIGSKLIKSITTYSIVVVIGIILFTIVGAKVLQSIV